MREIIVDRENGAKAFVLFELTKGNIAEIKDRYILEQLRSAIDSPWSTALPDGIRSALTRSVSEEMEDRFLLENMDKDTDRSVRSAIRSAVIFNCELNTVPCEEHYRNRVGIHRYQIHTRLVDCSPPGSRKLLCGIEEGSYELIIELIGFKLVLHQSRRVQQREIPQSRVAEAIHLRFHDLLAHVFRKHMVIEHTLH